MKNTIIALAASVVALGSVNAQLVVSSFTAGGNTIIWDVDNGQGTLTAVTTTPSGFTLAQGSADSNILTDGSNGTVFSGAVFATGEQVGDVTFSYTGAPILSDITGFFGSIGVTNVTVSGSAVVTSNFADISGPSGVLNVGDSLAGVVLSDDNSNAGITFSNFEIGTFSFTGAQSGAGHAGGISFSTVGVPEPSSALLLGLSALGFVGRRKR